MTNSESQPSWEDVLDLVARLDASGMDSAAVRVGDVSIEVSRSGPIAAAQQAAAPPPSAAPTSPAAEQTTAGTSSHSSAERTENSAAQNAGTPVEAPMVGVFYRSPSPGADPFVSDGDAVEADTTIGILEVMKMMNPITAGAAGRITTFAVADGEAVEFGQPIAYVDGGS